MARGQATTYRLGRRTLALIEALRLRRRWPNATASAVIREAVDLLAGSERDSPAPPRPGPAAEETTGTTGRDDT